MNITNMLQSAISLSEKYSTPAQTEKLRALADSIQTDKLKVVVLGDFKAGKSTLLNRLFIQKNLLPTDYMEATAVPTHLSNGPMGMRSWMYNPDGEDVLVNERVTFSEEDVAATVTASTEEERAAKAARYSRVNITMPGILPDNIILVDTPGLNTTNTAIYTGTLAEARSADAILYVVRAKQLSSREEELIADLAGNQKYKVPVHIVLTHDNAMAVTQLQNICQEIKAQLALRKVNCGVSVFTLSDDGKSNAPAVAGKISDIFDDDFLFGFDSTPAAPSTIEVSEHTENTLEEELLAFFKGEVRYGRTARIARELKPQLLNLKAKVESRLALAGAKEEEIKQIEARKSDIQKEYLRLIESLLSDIRAAQYQFIEIVEEDLDDVRKKYEKELQNKTSTGDILACISDWQSDIPQSMQRVLSRRKLDLQRDIDTISIKHQQELIKGLSPDGIETTMPSDWITKFVNFVPNWLLQLSDYLIFDLISPLPLVLDVFVRMFADKLPIIRDVLPANIAANVARKMAIQKLGECVTEIKQQVSKQLDAKFGEFNARLRKALTNADIFVEQDAAIAEVRNGTLSDAQKAELEAEMQQISQWEISL